MLKKMARRGLIGLVAGVALEHVIALVTSIILNMGYYSPCLVSLPERVGGEINAVLGNRRLPPRRRWLLFGVPVLICILLIVLLYLL